MQSDIFMCEKFMQICQNGPLDKFVTLIIYVF